MIAIVLLAVVPCGAADTFLTLCYHDIPSHASLPEDVPEHVFVNHLEYLRTNGYTVVSPDDILAAQKGLKPLPEKAVLLTFDDGYVSFYDFVLPVLKLYNYPAVLSVVTSWVEGTPGYVDKQLMNWEQIREAAQSDLVFVATHSHDLHKGGFLNPAGNVEPAGSTFLYFPDENRYETDAEFRSRIRTDLQKSISEMESKAGIRPWILTWPYGEYNRFGIDEAQKLGFKMLLTLEPRLSHLDDRDGVNRNIVKNIMQYDVFADKVEESFYYPEKIRAVQLDLDLIIDPDSYEQSDHNLGLVIERLVASGVNTVILQAFCDRDATGNIASVYFANDTLPVMEDFLSHAVNRIRIREMQVYVWMPVLGYKLPDAALNDALKVQELKNGRLQPTTSWYQRLSPFDPRTRTIVQALYRDLAANTRFDGILFQDDAYLTDFEDFHPAALRAFKERFGPGADPMALESAEIRQKWTLLKTETLDTFVNELTGVVRIYRPLAKIARNIYSVVLLNPYAPEWFSQNFDNYLSNYDYTVIMAYPQMEGIHRMYNIKKWFADLIARVNQSNAMEKVIFKLQTYDWARQEWIDEETLLKEFRFLVSSGVKHTGYYPDNVFENKPDMDQIAPMVSTRTIPRSWRQQ